MCSVGINISELVCDAQARLVKTQCQIIFKKTKQNLCASVFCLQVRYECLGDEIKIGDYYLRLLLEEDENEETNAIKRS